MDLEAVKSLHQLKYMYSMIIVFFFTSEWRILKRYIISKGIVSRFIATKWRILKRYSRYLLNEICLYMKYEMEPKSGEIQYYEKDLQRLNCFICTFLNPNPD